MKIFRPISLLFATLLLLALRVVAEPMEEYPLNLIIPAPDSAVRLARFETTPDETVAEKIMHLERAAREANPNAKEWSIYLTPAAALVTIKGWPAYMGGPEDATPIPEATLGECLMRIFNSAGLRYEIFNARVLIDVKPDKQNAQQSVPGYPPQGVGSPEP